MKVQLLYTVSKVPGIILTLISGKIVTKYGIGNTALSGSLLAYFGTILTYIGISNREYLYILIGRLIFGITEGLVFSTMLSAGGKWLSGGYLTVFFSVVETALNVVVSASAYIEPSIFIQDRGMEKPMFVYSLVCFTSVIASFIYWVVYDNNKAHNVGNLENKEKEEEFFKYKAGMKDFLILAKLPK